MRKVRQNLKEIGAPAIAHDKVRPLQLQAGDEGAVRLEDDLRMDAKRRPDQFAIAILVGRKKRRCTCRFQRDALSCRSLSRQCWQSLDFLDKPIQECSTHRRAVQTRRKTLRDIDRKPACAFGPGTARMGT